ncbi:hypothetical protein [Glutamicibacter arilaitensis]|uniref:hypothetical protein n=1 Tax=Glutamicibacter arilaitensis TaxID=256701 RepID=UPI003F928A3D
MTDGHSPADGAKGPAQKHHLELSAEDQLKYFTEQRRRAAVPMQKNIDFPPQTYHSETGEKQE